MLSNSFMYYLILFIMAILPSFIILKIVYSKDSDKEPKKLLLSLFGVGIISCFLTLVLSQVLETVFPFFNTEVSDLYKSNYFNMFIYCFIGIGLVEEWSKWLFDYGVVWSHKEFDHVYDAIVYSVFVSLGFATFENILYVMINGFRVALIRALFSVPAHACFGIMMGYYMGKAKSDLFKGMNTSSKKYLFLSILVPALLHGIFDFCLLSKNLLFIFMFFIFVIAVYIICIQKVKQISSVTNNIKDQVPNV